MPPAPEVKLVIVVVTMGSFRVLRRGGQSLYQDGDLEEDTLVTVLDFESLADKPDLIASLADKARGRGLPASEGEPLVIGVVGHGGQDLSHIGKIVDGICQKPDGDSFEDWEQAIRPLVVGLKFPDYQDDLSGEDTAGGVTEEEFAETLRLWLRAAAPREQS